MIIVDSNAMAVNNAYLMVTFCNSRIDSSVADVVPRSILLPLATVRGSVEVGVRIDKVVAVAIEFLRMAPINCFLLNEVTLFNADDPD